MFLMDTIWDYVPDNLLYQAFIQTFLIIGIGILFFLIFSIINKSFKNKVLGFFIGAIITVLLLSIVDIGEAYFRNYDTYTIYRKIFACIGYILRPLILFFITRIYTYNKHSNKVLMYLILVIPFIINIIIVTTSFYIDSNSLLFVIDYTSNNEIIRGPLVLSPFILSLYYFIIMIISGIKHLRFGYKKETILLIVLFITVIIVTILEMYFEYKGLLTGISMLSIIFYYMYYITYIYSKDYLTNTFTRFQLNKDIDKLKHEYTVYHLTVNGIKKINNTLGHSEGDKRLINVCNIIKEVSPINAKLYRYGGTEFVIIYNTNNIEHVIGFNSKINEALEIANYSISIGYSVKESNQTFEETLLNASKMMYLEKEYYHTECIEK